MRTTFFFIRKIDKLIFQFVKFRIKFVNCKPIKAKILIKIIPAWEYI